MSEKGLGKTGETYLKQWAKSKIFNRTHEIKNRFLEKGNVVEYESIMVLSDFLNIELNKNYDFFSDDFFIGTPDIITEDLIIDVKNCWDWSTFPYYEKECDNKNYEYQLQGYMHLTGRKKAQLIYLLSDTPEFLIEKEAFYFCRNQGYEELDMDLFDKFKDKMTYSDIDIKDKIKIFNINYNAEVIEKIKLRVEECRNYLKTLN